MSTIDELAAAVAQAGLDDGIDPSVGLRRGWDYWVPGQPLTDGCGIARTPHRLPVNLTTLPKGAVAIIDGTMTVARLAGSIWRQILTRPNDPNAGEGLDKFAVSSMAAHCGRAEHLVTLVGHSPRDVAMYLDDLRLRDRALFERVIAKDFKGAIALRPTIADDPWPDRVRAMWVKREADYLPPFLVAVLYAELARLAVNQAGLIAMAFDDGVELTKAKFLSRVPLAGGPHEPRSIMRAINMLPYQSIALSAPGTVLRGGDAEAAAAWAKVCAATLAAAVEERGNITIVPTTPTEAEAIRDDVAASPPYWLEHRKKYGWSRQYRPAATLWGLDWRQHGSVGLMEIMATARDWNERLRPSGRKLSSMSKRRVSWAITTINFAWVVEANPAAALTLWEAARDETSNDPVLGNVDPFGIDRAHKGMSGDSLRMKAIDLLADRPKPGELGYTARYRGHLWLNDRGDDIAHYRHFQWDALLGFHRAKKGFLPEVLTDTSRVPAEVVAVLARTHRVSPRHGVIENNRSSALMTDDIAAARGAQNVAMMISPLAMDPMREMLLRAPKATDKKGEGES